MGMDHRIQNSSNSSQLRDTEEEISTELIQAQKNEENLWKQKSRVTWLTILVLNTKFFHLSTIVRRRRNNIDAIKNENGILLYDREEIGRHIEKYFQRLFARNNNYPRGLHGLIP